MKIADGGNEKLGDKAETAKLYRIPCGVCDKLDWAIQPADPDNPGMCYECYDKVRRTGAGSGDASQSLDSPSLLTD